VASDSEFPEILARNAAQYADQTHPAGKDVASLGPRLEKLLGNSLVWYRPLLLPAIGYAGWQW